MKPRKFYTLSINLLLASLPICAQEQQNNLPSAGNTNRADVVPGGRGTTESLPSANGEDQSGSQSGSNSSDATGNPAITGGRGNNETTSPANSRQGSQQSADRSPGPVDQTDRQGNASAVSRDTRERESSVPGSEDQAATSISKSEPSQPAAPRTQDREQKSRLPDVPAETTEQIVSSWPERPRLGARQMLKKYGQPQEATSEKLVWHDQGPFKRINVTKSEDHHDFPLPHTDFMEHTIDYKVPPGKADELVKFDGSVTFDRTKGEMSARCDLEGHNILSLNMAHDVVTGKRSAEEARKAFGEAVADDMAGKSPAYTVSLQFEPMTKTKDSDKPTMPGAPKRAMKAGDDADPEVKNSSSNSEDAAILSMLLAVDTNEIVAAKEAAKRELRPDVKEYAKMLHTEHGKHAAATMSLAEKVDVTPLDTERSDQLRIKGAGELAALVPLDDQQFSDAYLKAMIKGHTEVLEMIDNEMTSKAENESLKKHLADTRNHIQMHLDKAKEIQNSTSH